MKDFGKGGTLGFSGGGWGTWRGSDPSASGGVPSGILVPFGVNLASRFPISAFWELLGVWKPPRRCPPSSIPGGIPAHADAPPTSDHEELDPVPAWVNKAFTLSNSSINCVFWVRRWLTSSTSKALWRSTPWGSATPEAPFAVAPIVASHSSGILPCVLFWTTPSPRWTSILLGGVS